MIFGPCPPRSIPGSEGRGGAEKGENPVKRCLLLLFILALLLPAAGLTDDTRGFQPGIVPEFLKQYADYEAVDGWYLACAEAPPPGGDTRDEDVDWVLLDGEGNVLVEGLRWENWGLNTPFYGFLGDAGTIDIAKVRVGDKWGFIDRTGAMVVEPRYTYVSPFSEGLAAVREESGL